MKRKKRVLILGLAAVLSAVTIGTAAASPRSGSNLLGDFESDVTYQADVVVVGAGFTGMTAALQAYQAGAENVVLIEQLAIVGGVGLQASGGINAAESRYQLEMGIGPTKEENFTMTRGTGIIQNEDLLWALINNAADAIHWLNDYFDAGFVGTTMTQERAHRPESLGLAFDMANPTVGYYLVNALTRGLAEYDIPVLFNTLATNVLLDEEGRVAGVFGIRADGTTVIVEAPAVILATGAYNSMTGTGPLAEGGFLPTVTAVELNRIRVNHMDYSLPGAGVAFLPEFRGSALQLASQVNGDTAGFYNLTIRHAAVMPLGPGGATPHNWAPELFENGAVVVNNQGERFMDEAADARDFADAILGQTGIRFVVFDKEIADGVEAFEDYLEAGVLHMADSVIELAELMSVDAEALADTLEEAGIEGPEFFAGVINAVVGGGTAGAGGVKINGYGEVINVYGEVIPGLYAAGPSAGGVFGGGAGGGNTLPEVFVFGRIAGESAAEFVMELGVTERTIESNHIVQPVAEPQASGGFADGVHEGIGLGFAGTTTLEVRVEDGNIVCIEIIETADTRTYFSFASLGTIDQIGVIAQIIINQSTEVDVVAGVTHSSMAIMRAVEDALGGPSGQEANGGANGPGAQGNFEDGVFRGEGRGYSPYYDGTAASISTVVVEVTVEEGSIIGIEIISHQDSPAFMMLAGTVITGRIIEAQGINVDVVAGATGSSNGILLAVKDALGLE